MANPRDAESATRLKTAQLVQQLDPFQEHISDRQRESMIIEAFGKAGLRLKSCERLRDAGPAEGSQRSLWQSWEEMKPHVTYSDFRKHPEMAEAAMDLVFKIEREAATRCGTPNETDTALLLIAKSHEGV